MSFIAKDVPRSCTVFSCRFPLLCNTSLEPFFVVHSVDVAEAFSYFEGSPSIWVYLTGFLMIRLRFYTSDRNAKEAIFCPQCIMSEGTCWFVPVLGILSSVTPWTWYLPGFSTVALLIFCYVIKYLMGLCKYSVLPLIFTH